MEAIWLFIKVIAKACGKIFVIGSLAWCMVNAVKELNDYLDDDNSI